MQHQLINLSLLCLLVFTSCSETALYDLNITPRQEIDQQKISVMTDRPEAPKLPLPGLISRQNALTLQVVRSTISTETGNLVIFFSGDGELSGLQLADQQTLEFVDAEGGLFRQTLPVLNATLTDQLLEVSFGTGRGYGPDAEPQGEQSIIIEDVIVN